MKGYLFILYWIFCISGAYAQTVIKIKPGSQIKNTGAAFNIQAGSFVNNGTYTDNTSPGAFNVNDGVTFSGAGTTMIYNLNVNNTGTTTLNSLISVLNTATLTSGTLTAGSNNLYIRTDMNASANLVDAGVLAGIVKGLVTNATVTTGPCPVSSTLSTNVSGPVISYQWQSSADNNIWNNISGATSATYAATATATTYYRCSLTSTNSSYNEPTPGVLITTTGGPSIHAGSVAAICNGSSTTLSATGGSTYSWAPSAGLLTTTGASISAAPSLPITYTVTGTDGLGCSNTATVVVTVNPAPGVVTVTGGGSLCSNATITASGGTGGIIYFEGTTSGGVSTINPAISEVVTSSGTYYFRSRSSLGCWGAEGSATVSVSSPPAIHTFTGGGAYCAGDPGVHIGLTLTDPGISYQLYHGSTPKLPVVNGTGAAIDFGVYDSVGSYHVIATNTTTHCTTYLTGVTVSVNPLPDTFTVTGGGSYCFGGAGLHAGLHGSASGINYQLYNDGNPVGTAMAGIGSALDFGSQTDTGTYTIIATNATTLCTQSMAGSVTITLLPQPTVFNVAGGGTYCLSGSGVAVGLDSSETGVTYQLVNVIPFGGSIAGTGHPLTLGTEFVPGSYTVIATSTVNSCTVTMNRHVNVNFSLPPTPFFVTATNGGSYCVGDSGVHVGLNTSNTGVSYQLYRNNTAIGSTVAGTGSALDFGLFTTVGTYTVSATNGGAGCTSNMLGSAVVVANPVVMPTVSISTGLGAGDTVCMGTAAIFTGQTTNGGTAPSYQWLLNGTGVGTADSTFNFSPVAGDVITVIMTSNALCVRPDTAINSMAVNVEIPAPPSVFIVASPAVSIAIGQRDTFTAVTTNCGSSPQYQWSVNGSIVPGATSSVFTGTFNNHDSICCSVITTGACGGRMTFDCVDITVFSTGMTQVAQAGSDVRLIPNPNKGTFIVKGTLGTIEDEEVSLEITDMLGQVVYHNKVTAHSGILNEQVQLTSNLANGMYMLNLLSATDHKVFHFVIEQ